MAANERRWRRFIDWRLFLMLAMVLALAAFNEPRLWTVDTRVGWHFSPFGWSFLIVVAACLVKSVRAVWRGDDQTPTTMVIVASGVWTLLLVLLPLLTVSSLP